MNSNGKFWRHCFDLTLQDNRKVMSVWKEARDRGRFSVGVFTHIMYDSAS